MYKINGWQWGLLALACLALLIAVNQRFGCI